MRILYVVVLAAGAHYAAAQSTADEPILAARGADPAMSLKAWFAAGRLTLIGWDKDSIVVRGRIARDAQFSLAGERSSMKLEVRAKTDAGSATTPGPSDVVVYLPRGGKVAAKAVTADVVATDISGWIYSVSGAIRLAGSASSIEVESMNGNIDLDVATPWLRARTGDGHLLLRGTPQDVDVATIGGALDVAAAGVMRGQFGSVSGDIRYAGTPSAGAIFDFSNHSGGVEIALPSNASAAVMLSSVAGVIENGFAHVRPISTSPHAIRLSLGRGEAQLTVRSFKGVIRLRPQ
jgi:hypothetical protein